MRCASRAVMPAGGMGCRWSRWRADIYLTHSVPRDVIGANHAGRMTLPKVDRGSWLTSPPRWGVQSLRRSISCGPYSALFECYFHKPDGLVAASCWPASATASPSATRLSQGQRNVASEAYEVELCMRGVSSAKDQGEEGVVTVESPAESYGS